MKKKRLTNKEIRLFRYSMKQMRVRMVALTKRRCRTLKKKEEINEENEIEDHFELEDHELKD